MQCEVILGSTLIRTAILMQPILGKISFYPLQMSSAPLTRACTVWVLLSKWHCAHGVSPSTKERTFWSKNSTSISSIPSVVSCANKNSPFNHSKLQSLLSFPALACQSQVSAMSLARILCYVPVYNLNSTSHVSLLQGKCHSPCSLTHTCVRASAKHFASL